MSNQNGYFSERFFLAKPYKLSSTNNHTLGLKLIVDKIGEGSIRKGKAAWRKLKEYHYSPSSSPHVLLGAGNKLNGEQSRLSIVKPTFDSSFLR
jgi:hypothetical protein